MTRRIFGFTLGLLAAATIAHAGPVLPTGASLRARRTCLFPKRYNPPRHVLARAV
jgi:hypothetical protein